MTQEQIEQTRVIAEKDGWEDTGKPKRKGSEETGGEWYAKGSVGCWLDAMPYLTDLNALHKVAIDVLEGLFALNSISINRNSIKLIGAIRGAMFHRPINGQYIDLFNAVYEGIVFLNENKA